MIHAAQSGGSPQLLDMIHRLEARVVQLESILVHRGATVQLIGGDAMIDFGAHGVQILSTSTLRLQCGDSIIEMGPSGVRITSQEIDLTSANKTLIKAGGEIVLKGSKIVQN
jgi:hypothetical protein